MKLNIKEILVGAMIAMSLAVSSCNDVQDDNFVGAENSVPDNVPVAIYEAFMRNYPDVAGKETWEVDDTYAKATFPADGYSSRSDVESNAVWYALADSQRKMQSEIIRFDALPEAVRNAVAQSAYGEWEIEQTALWLRRYVTGMLEDLYVVKASGSVGSAKTTALLYYTAAGLLVKETVDSVYDEAYGDVTVDYDEWLPQTGQDFVDEYLKMNYPSASILFIKKDRNGTMVKILNDRNSVVITFDLSGQWQSTSAEVRERDLSAGIEGAFESSQYSAYEIEDIREYSDASGEHYFQFTVKPPKGDKFTINIYDDYTVAGPAVDTPDQPSPGDGNDGSDKDNPKDKGDGDKNDDGGNNNNDDDREGRPTAEAKATAEEFIRQNYPGAVVTDRDYDNSKAEIEITYNGNKITVSFVYEASSYKWSGSEWDLDYMSGSVVPDAIFATVKEKYGEYTIYYVKYCESPSVENYYMVGLKSAQLKRDIKVRMTPSGAVVAEYANQ